MSRSTVPTFGSRASTWPVGGATPQPPVASIAAIPDQVSDAPIALSIVVASTPGTPSYAWTATGPSGDETAACLSSTTSATPTLDPGAAAGKVGGRWVVACTVTAMGLETTVYRSFEVGVDGLVIDTYDFSGTKNVSGSTLSVGGVTWTLLSGTWTSDAAGVQINSAGSGASGSMAAALADLIPAGVEFARFAVVFDGALNFSGTAPTATNWQVLNVDCRQTDDSTLVGVLADRHTATPSGEGVRARRSSPDSWTKVLVSAATITGLMYEISGRRDANGNAFFRAYYSTVAAPSLADGLADWTQVGSGWPTGLEQPDDAVVGAQKLELRCSTGSAGAAFRADIARIEVASLR